jgi:hypothetical protein
VGFVKRSLGFQVLVLQADTLHATHLHSVIQSRWKVRNSFSRLDISIGALPYPGRTAAPCDLTSFKFSTDRAFPGQSDQFLWGRTPFSTGVAGSGPFYRADITRHARRVNPRCQRDLDVFDGSSCRKKARRSSRTFWRSPKENGLVCFEPQAGRVYLPRHLAAKQAGDTSPRTESVPSEPKVE